MICDRIFVKSRSNKLTLGLFSVKINEKKGLKLHFSVT